jgi:acyl-CoA reductase-like NAD-dependent aldehyde dehydrogenase
VGVVNDVAVAYGEPQQKITESPQIVVRCPADGRVVGRVPDMSAQDVAAAAQALREEQAEWEAIGFAGRRRWLRLFRDWLLDNQDRLHRLVREETGKSWGDLSMGEVAVAVDVLNYYADHGEAFLASRSPRPHSAAMITKKLVVERSPYPLVGVITPWNAQIANAMLDIPAALMAGCAVLSKPSEETPLTWVEVVRGWREDIGAPKVLDCVTGAGATGAAVVDNVDMIQFTGSTATGRKIAARAGERLIPTSLELGGKDPTIICADADLDRAVGAVVWGAMHNAGQICVSVERVYVEAPIYEEFVDRVLDTVSQLRWGMDAPGEFATDYGAILTASQLGTVEQHVQDARDKGATIRTGGRSASEGLFYEPTVMTEVDHTMECMREETFGPTLPIMKVGSINEAVRLANDSPYGLSASVWTRDEPKGRDIARRIHAGSVNVNNVLTNVFQLPVPMSGWGDSGLGSRNGPEGILRYTRSQSVISERVAIRRELYWYPRTVGRAKTMARLTRLLGARDWRRRLAR